MEKAMAPHSSTLAWKIPWTEELGRLWSMGSQLSNFTFPFHFHALEKKMATHSSVLSWRIPGTEEPDGLPSMGLHSWTWLKWLNSSSSSRSSLAGLEEKKFLESTIFFLGKKVLWLTHFYLWNAQWGALVFTTITTVRWKKFDLCTGHK